MAGWRGRSRTALPSPGCALRTTSACCWSESLGRLPPVRPCSRAAIRPARISFAQQGNLLPFTLRDRWSDRSSPFVYFSPALVTSGSSPQNLRSSARFAPMANCVSTIGANESCCIDSPSVFSERANDHQHTSDSQNYEDQDRQDCCNHFVFLSEITRHLSINTCKRTRSGDRPTFQYAARRTRNTPASASPGPASADPPPPRPRAGSRSSCLVGRFCNPRRRSVACSVSGRAEKGTARAKSAPSSSRTSPFSFVRDLWPAMALRHPGVARIAVLHSLLPTWEQYTIEL
jgi:hypothetical protein